MKFIIYLSFLFLFSNSVAQNDQSEKQDISNKQDNPVKHSNPRKIARDGNANYKGNLYSEAEIQYRKSLSDNKSFDEAKFNLSNSLFKQGRYSESLDLLNDIVKTTNDSIFQSEVYYNMGNNYMMMADNNTQDPNLINESLNDAINSYKNCLTINPSDEQARHNLSKALRRLQKQEQNQNQNNNDKERDKEEQKKQNSGQTDGEDEKNENNKQSAEDENRSKDGGKSSSNEKEQGDSDGKSLGNQLSKEDMERMLEALDREEKDVQEKMRKINFSKQKNKKIEKDW